METAERREVVVVGGGPAGAACARWLAELGHDVLVLDRARFPRPKPCAEYTSPRAEDVLKRLGALDAVERAGARRLRGIRVRAPGGVVWRLEHRDGGMSRHNLALPRDRVDAALLRHALASGADVRQGTLVRRIERDDAGRLQLEVVNASRQTRRLQPRLLVGADGVRSVVARDLGLVRSLRWPRCLGLAARFAAVEQPGEWAELHLGRGVYAGLTPLDDHTATVSIVTRLSGGARTPDGAQAFFEALLARLPSLARRLVGAQPLDRPRGVGPIGLRVARPWAPGALLVGDAAGFFDPLAGDGIYLALRGAELAAEVAHTALRRGDASRLRDYEALRAREFGAKARLARVLRLCASWPPLADYAVARLARRAAAAEPLAAALGDYGPAERALHPAVLLALLRP